MSSGQLRNFGYTRCFDRYFKIPSLRTKFSFKMTTIELVKARKGRFLHVDGYLYYKHSSPKNRVYWNCRNKVECGAPVVNSAITNPDNIIIHKMSPHNHAPNREAVQAKKIGAGVKRTATEHSEMPPARVMRRELRDVPSEVLEELPNRPNLAKQVSRTRLRNLPPNPMRIADLEKIPAIYTQTLGGSRFLMYDSYEDDEENENEPRGRVLVFATRENLIQLFRCDIWFVEGTFKTAPSLFFQIFLILGRLVNESDVG